MIEGHTTSGQVAPMLVRCKLDVAIPSERFQDFDFDQRHLTIDVVVLGIPSQSRRVSVAFDADSGD
jgi:hypothetical protein